MDRIAELQEEREAYVAQFPADEAEVRRQHWDESTEGGEELYELEGQAKPL